jgi:dihydroorotate dehydrogenase electron transfer subunit
VSSAASAEDVPTPLRVGAEVVSNLSDSGDNRRLVLRVPGWPGFAPGQFVMLSPGACSDVVRSDPLLPRPMAVFRARGNEVEFLYKVVGRGTGLLAEARPGERVRVVGPLGRGFPEPVAGERALLVAGGTGIASVYELAKQLAERGNSQARRRRARSEAERGEPSREPSEVGQMEPVVMLGARTRDDLMGLDAFEELGVPVEVATEDGSAGREGLVTALLEDALKEGPGARVYACGPTPMMFAAAKIAAARGAPCVVSLENTMACGFGVCLGCAAPLRDGGSALVCRDGPVFDASRLQWDALP